MLGHIDLWFWSEVPWRRKALDPLSSVFVPDDDLSIRSELHDGRLCVPSRIVVRMDLVVTVLAEQFQIVKVQRYLRVIYISVIEMDPVMDEVSPLPTDFAFSLSVCDERVPALRPLLGMIELLDLRSVFAWHCFLPFGKEVAESEDTFPLRPAWQETISPQASIFFRKSRIKMRFLGTQIKKCPKSRENVASGVDHASYRPRGCFFEKSGHIYFRASRALGFNFFGYPPGWGVSTTAPGVPTYNFAKRPRLLGWYLASLPVAVAKS